MFKLARAALLVVAVTPAVLAQSPHVEVRSQSIASGEVELLPTLDGARVYRFTVDLDFRNLAPGAVIDYEVRSATGAAAGGGMFTVSPDMMNADGKVSVLTGFAGLEFKPGDVILVKLADLNLAPPDPSKPKKLVANAFGIVDTCTTYCDRCADKAGTLCNLGVVTFNCSCSGETRSFRARHDPRVRFGE